MESQKPTNTRSEPNLDQIKIIDILKRADRNWVVTKEFVDNRLVITIRIAVLDSTEPFASVTVDDANQCLLVSYDEGYNRTQGCDIYKHLLEYYLNRETDLSVYLS
ncbi:MAG TPA: hypothetical protein PLI45_04750 [Candidatus Woesebacteria bacterium]|nr:hypothetical protein [Candidatus Woesebacteria bacterium]